ncbi:MAG TPA: alpha/beta fold hydrolase, partial [Lapillicoccus sp.]|nr:alpha/beta fold hydrolase [Lapillicoccus sp.]
MEQTRFTARTSSGERGGWVTGDGPPVVALHGGPGLGYEYMDEVVAEVAARYRVATFQQRGLSPSVLDGGFTIAEAVADIAAVLDELGWDTAYLLGHSWGGHLAFHAAAAIPERLAGVLAVDPLGAVGDGGSAAFGAELMA